MLRNVVLRSSTASRGRRAPGFVGMMAAGVVLAASGSAMAQKGADGTGSGQSRLRPLNVTVNPIRAMTTSPDGNVGGPSPRGTCPPHVVTYTDANFEGGSFVVQSGFAQTEIAAVSFTLTATAFPLKLDLAEMIFATSSATQQTTTEWGIRVWSGNPVTGTLVASYDSDGVILPHLIIPPGTNGVNVQVSVDPGDPDQIIMDAPADGTNSFTVGYTINHHNQQTQNPCLVSPPACCNAFPTTDTSGLSRSTENWLFGVNCGPFGCPANGGWARFSQLASFCRPSGDWVIRVTWESVNCTDPVGACCLPNGTCEIRTQAACTSGGGTYQGDNVLCGSVNCPQPVQACCFQSTGGCLNLTPSNCISAGGTPGGAGTTCQSFVCFPMGACCLPDGSCVGPVSPAACTSQGGTFQGNATACGTTNCPVPTGACCFPNGFCLELQQSECAAGGGVYQGTGTTCAAVHCPLPTGACCFPTGFCLVLTQQECADGGGSYLGTGTACGPNTCSPACPCDFNNSGTLNSQDFFDFLSCFFTPGCAQADFNTDQQVNSQDFFDFLSCFFAPPNGC